MVEGRLMITGEYNKNGYVILRGEDGEVLYSAGANTFDSTAPGRDLSLAKIRAMCMKTGKEIAAEKGDVWGGVERIEE
jgi:hypothetical protein